MLKGEKKEVPPKGEEDMPLKEKDKVPNGEE